MNRMLTNASQIHARTELHVPTHVDHLPVHVIRDGQVLSVIKISSNVILIHVKTEVVAKTMTDLSLVRVMLDGQGRCAMS